MLVGSGFCAIATKSSAPHDLPSCVKTNRPAGRFFRPLWKAHQDLKFNVIFLDRYVRNGPLVHTPSARS